MNLDWLNESLADELTDSGLLLSIAGESLSMPLVGVYSIDVTYVDDSTEQFTGTGTLLIDGSIERHIKSIVGTDSEGNIFVDVNQENGSIVPELIQNKDGVTNGTFEQLYEQQTYTIAGNNSDFIGLANLASDTAVRGIQGNLVAEFEGLDENTSSRIFLNLLTCRLLSLVASDGLEYDAKSHAQAGVSISQVFCYSLRVYARGISCNFSLGNDAYIERCFIRRLGRHQSSDFTVNVINSVGTVGMVGQNVTLNTHDFIQLDRAVVGNASTATTANFSNVVSVASNFQLGQNVASYEAFGTRVNVDSSIIRQANIGNHQGANNLFGVDATSAFADSENGDYTINQAFAEANLIGKGVNGSNIAEFAYSTPVNTGLEQQLVAINSEQVNESFLVDINQDVTFSGIASETVNESSVSSINTDLTLETLASEQLNESLVSQVTTSSGQLLSVVSSEQLNESLTASVAISQHIASVVSEQLNESDVSIVDAELSLFGIASEQTNESFVGDITQSSGQLLAVISSEQLNESNATKIAIQQSLLVSVSEQANESSTADISQFSELVVINSEQLNESFLANITSGAEVINFGTIRMTDITPNKFHFTDITTNKFTIN